MESARTIVLNLALLAIVSTLFPATARPDPRPPRPIPAISRALIVSIDGLRPDALLRAEAPAIRSLMNRGAYTMWAQTTAVAVTLPSHVSMLTGVPPEKHGINWNNDRALSPGEYSKWPTLFELSRRVGYTAAMAAGKSKFLALAQPGTLDWSFVPSKTVISDNEVTGRAVEFIAHSAPQVLFVHLPGVDTAGHAKGWGSPTQLAAIAVADRCVGRLLEAIRSRGVLDSTVVIVTSDHGGAARSHGANDPRSREIPWIISGPGVCHDLDLTTIGGLDIRTEDTFATVAWLLGIRVARPVDGRAVTQIRCATPSR